MELKLTLSGNNVLQVIHEDGRVEEKQLIFPLDTYSEDMFLSTDLYKKQVRYSVEKGVTGVYVYKLIITNSHCIGESRLSCGINEAGYVDLSKTILLDIYHNQTSNVEFCDAFRKEVFEYFTNKLIPATPKESSDG